MKVRYSRRASADLIEIGEYLRMTSPAVSQSIEQKFRRDIEPLRDFPALGRITIDPDIRMFPIVR